MSEQPILKEENLIIIKEIESKPHITQRELSEKTGVSLGKINYLLKELIKKGFVEVRNFSNNPGKLKKIHYYLTKEGLKHKFQVAFYFLKSKETEYNQLKQEWGEFVLSENGFNENPQEKE